MKFRKGFVSNSSTSSFTCEVCDRKEVFWDGCDVRDYGLMYCDNEHLICEEHALGDKKPGDSYSHLSSECCPICQFEVISVHDLNSYLKKITGIKEDEVFQKIKQTNKRRRKLYRFEYIEYALNSLGKTEDDLVKEIKDKFGSLDEFNKFLWSK